MWSFAILWYTLLLGSSFGLYHFFSQENEFHFGSILSQKYYANYFWIFIIYIFSEFCFIMLSKYDERKEKSIEISDEEKENSLRNVSVIIPVHNTPFEEIEKNILHLKNIFSSGTIHIAENDGNENKNVELYTLCQLHGAFYHHFTFGNKSNAILKTAQYIRCYMPEVNYVVLLDDDTIIEPNFFIRKDILDDPTVAGYTCVIGVERKNKEKPNWIEECIDLEYRTISYRNRSRNLHTLKFLHGIICVYKIEPLLEIYKWNICNIGGLPFGEDAFAGLKARFIGYKLKQDHLNKVRTFCPINLYPSLNMSREQGYGASNVFKQRAKRWYISWTRRLFDEIALLLCYDTGTWLGNFLYRVDFIWYIYITIISSIWMLIFFSTFFNLKNFVTFVIVHVGFYIINILNTYWRIVNMSNREKEGIRWTTPFLFYWFNINLLFMYTFAFLYSIFYYIPFVRVDYKKLYNKENMRTICN